jgi:hypothetical protein
MSEARNRNTLLDVTEAVPTVSAGIRRDPHDDD